MYVHIFGYLVNKLEIWWVYLSPIEKYQPLYSSHRANMQGTQATETSGHVFNCTMEILP